MATHFPRVIRMFVISLGWFVILALPHSAPLLARSQVGAVNDLCSSTANTESALIPESTLSSLVDTTEIRAWVHGQTTAMPVGSEFDFRLMEVDLEPGGSGGPTKSRHDNVDGPVLILGSHGVIDAVDTGLPTSLVPGQGLLIEAYHEFWLENSSSESAQALLLAVLPPGDRVMISATGAVHQVERPEVEPIAGASRNLFLGTARSLERTSTSITLLCLHLENPGAEVEPARYEGPVGLYIVSGTARLNDDQDLEAGSCWLFPPHAPVWIRSERDDLDLIMFGAWNQESPATPMSRDAAKENSSAYEPLSCEGPSADDASESE